jgi:hypothetical protein
MSLPSASVSGVGDLQPDHRLARDHLDDAHADHRQRARQVLGQVGDAADLGAGGQAQLEARDHRSGVHRVDLDLDAEVAQLELDLPRHRLERFGGVTTLRRRWAVQQRQRRQRVTIALEQRHLLLALDPFARLDLLDHRFDAGRLALAAFLRLRLGDLLAVATRAAPGEALAQQLEAAAQPGEQFQRAAPGLLHQVEPRQAGRQGHAGQEQREQEQRRTEEAEGADQRPADHVAEHAAGVERHGQRRVLEVQARQAAAGRHGHDEADQAQPQVRPVDAAVGQRAPRRQPPSVGDQHREQERHVAEKVERDVGEPGAGDAAGVAHLAGRPAVGPAGITRVVGQQRDQQVEGERADDEQRALPRRAREVPGEAAALGLLLTRLTYQSSRPGRGMPAAALRQCVTLPVWGHCVVSAAFRTATPAPHRHLRNDASTGRKIRKRLYT